MSMTINWNRNEKINELCKTRFREKTWYTFAQERCGMFTGRDVVRLQEREMWYVRERDNGTFVINYRNFSCTPHGNNAHCHPFTGIVTYFYCTCIRWCTRQHARGSLSYFAKYKVDQQHCTYRAFKLCLQ